MTTVRWLDEGLQASLSYDEYKTCSTSCCLISVVWKRIRSMPCIVACISDSLSSNKFSKMNGHKRWVSTAMLVHCSQITSVLSQICPLVLSHVLGRHAPSWHQRTRDDVGRLLVWAEKWCEEKTPCTSRWQCSVFIVHTGKAEEDLLHINKSQTKKHLFAYCFHTALAHHRKFIATSNEEYIW